MKHFALRCLLLTLTIALPAKAGMPDTPFIQEWHEAYPIAPEAPGDDVRAIAAAPDGAIWAATKAGLYVLRNQTWNGPLTKGPAYRLVIDDAGTVWLGAWDGLYQITNDQPTRIDATKGVISALALTPKGITALGIEGAWRRENNEWKSLQGNWSRNLRDLIEDESGNLWIATGMGLYCETPIGLRHFYRPDDLLSGDVNALAIGPKGQLWIGSWSGIDIYEHGVRTESFTGAKGLPHYDIRSLTFAPDGTLWAGTALGAARFKDGAWSLRHSRRWLLSDDVRDIAFDAQGNAWIATSAGVSAIKQRTMTLEEKASHYQAICEKRHIRPPGFVEKCYFPDPQNHDIWEPRDDDNDGQYTNIYMVAESFRYAATGDPQAKANADRAFDAIEMLRTITGMDGFFARTIVPSDWTRMADMNETISPEEAAERQVRDPRYKPVEIRWRLSADGKWFWKGDTSSDEMTGHFYGAYYYYTLAADESHKERVRAQIAAIAGHMLDHNYTLTDQDGKPTRWGVWTPDRLLKDPEWRVEAPINAFEALSFLKTAYYITSEPRFEKAYQTLIEKYGYDELARRPKCYGISERTHIDDELLALAAPGLIFNETNPALRAKFLEGIVWSYQSIKNDVNPFSNFTLGALGAKTFQLKDSVEFLRDTPLDLVMWTVDNATREDLNLVRAPMLEPLQLDRLVPPSERGVMRWDKNPWEVISGDFGDPKGHLESSGVFWLLPYWMGRYYGFIDPPK